MWLDVKAVIHVVDIDNHFNSAQTLQGKTVDHVWDAFVSCWRTLCIGNPLKIRVDQRSAFTYVRWTRLCDNMGIKVQESEFEHQNALGSGERYHDPLRRIYKKVKHEHPAMENKLALRISLKAMNETMGAEGLVHSLLIFGTLPSFIVTTSNIAEQNKSMKALSEARREMASVTAEIRIRKALLSNAPRNTDVIINLDDKVRVFRETDRKYIGPFPVIRTEKKQMFVV